MLEIIDNRGAPPELIRIINAECKDHEIVKTVVFDAFIDYMEGNLGAFNPNTGTIIIDMGNCLTNKTWMSKGIMYIANAWFNLVVSFFHELTHANQLKDHPELKELEQLPIEYEQDAEEMSKIRLIKWLYHNNVPLLNEMNWVGDQIKELFNKAYSIMPELINEEIDLQGTAAAANAMVAANKSKSYASVEETAKLLKQIDEGLLGVKIGGERYLTAYEAVDMDH